MALFLVMIKIAIMLINSIISQMRKPIIQIILPGLPKLFLYLKRLLSVANLAIPS